MNRSYGTLVAIALAVAPSCGGDPEGVIEGWGTIEIVELEVAPVVSARVERMLVREGEPVRKGDTIAVLTTPTLAAELEQARAEEARAVAALDELRRGAQVREIERAEAQVAALEAELGRLVSDSLRLAPLAGARLIAEAEMTGARSAVVAAAAQRDAAVATLRLVREGTRSERIEAASADVRRARAGIASAEATAGDLVLRAAVDGVVISRNAEPGEVIPAGRSVATLGESSRPYVYVYLGPQHVPVLQPGDSVSAALDAFPDRRFRGRIASIATRAEYTPRVALTETERADLLFAVRVDLEYERGMLKPGLPVTVRFFPRGGPAASPASEVP